MESRKRTARPRSACGRWSGLIHPPNFLAGPAAMELEPEVTVMRPAVGPASAPAWGRSLPAEEFEYGLPTRLGLLKPHAVVRVADDDAPPSFLGKQPFQLP